MSISLISSVKITSNMLHPNKNANVTWDKILIENLSPDYQHTTITISNKYRSNFKWRHLFVSLQSLFTVDVDLSFLLVKIRLLLLLVFVLQLLFVSFLIDFVLVIFIFPFYPILMLIFLECFFHWFFCFV